MRKYAIVSHVFPPSPSGQATVIRRLLEGVDPTSYCLISRQNYEASAIAGEKSGHLPASYYHLGRDISKRGPLGWSPFLEFFTVPMALMLRAIRIARIIKREAVHTLVGCTGDLLDLPASFLASRLVAIPFFAYLFDDYVYQWSDPADRRLAKWFAHWIMDGATGVIVPNEFLQEDYQKRHGITCTIVRNPGFEPVADASPANARLKDEVRIVYTGAVYHAHYDSFLRLVEAISLIEQPDVRLHIYTFQSPDNLAKEGLVGPLLFHDHLPSEEIAIIQRQADILFLPLAFESPIPEVIRASAPGKMGEYLGSGRPILVHAPSNSFVSWYFQKHECGLVVDQPDHKALRREIARLLEDPELRKRLAERALECAAQEFSPRKARQTFLDLIHVSNNSH